MRFQSFFAVFLQENRNFLFRDGFAWRRRQLPAYGKNGVQTAGKDRETTWKKSTEEGRKL